MLASCAGWVGRGVEVGRVGVGGAGVFVGRGVGDNPGVGEIVGVREAVGVLGKVFVGARVSTEGVLVDVARIAPALTLGGNAVKIAT